MAQSDILILAGEAELRARLLAPLQADDQAVIVAASCKAGAEQLGRRAVGLVLVHPDSVPDWPRLRQVGTAPVILLSDTLTVAAAAEAMRRGATDCLAFPADAEAVRGIVARWHRPSHGLIAEDPRALEALRLAERVAPKDVTVLLTGESGTGKEVYARRIHQCSPRAGGPFVAVNCAAIPENMLEATLFGFERGAFTGAHAAHAGKFEQAQGGTLLLDEVSEIEPGLQAKLLRVLQEREIERLCGKQTIELDLRVLATSNRDLRAEVQAGRFREDLYYRLHVFPIRLPALRERPADILPLTQYLLRKHAHLADAEPRLSEAAAERLRAHGWPGNVRELENVVQRALVLAVDGEIDAQALRFDEGGAAAAAADQGLDQDLKHREQRLILDTLRAARGSRKLAAERLGISDRTLRYKLARMREAGLRVPGGAGAECA